MEEINIALKHNVRQCLVELYGKEKVDDNWEMVEDAMAHTLIFSNKLPINNVSDCSHEWRGETYDNMGFALTEYCDKCDLTRDCC